MVNQEEFQKDIDPLKPQLEAFLMKWYGKCPDYDESCIACRMWMAVDLLLDNPFEEI